MTLYRVKLIYIACFSEEPIVVVPPSDLSLDVGSRAIFQCKVYGAPPPMVTWLHNSRPITASQLIMISGESEFGLQIN